MSGEKHDTGKARWTLLPRPAMREVVGVLDFGAAKYAPWNWVRVEQPLERYTDALERHMDQWLAGEDLDQESGRHHLAHVAVNALFLLSFELGAARKPARFEPRSLACSQCGVRVSMLAGGLCPPCAFPDDDDDEPMPPPVMPTPRFSIVLEPAPVEPAAELAPPAAAAAAAAATKRCSKCETERPVTEFNRQARSRDGLYPWCKPCRAEADRVYGAQKRAQRKAAAPAPSPTPAREPAVAKKLCRRCQTTKPAAEFGFRSPSGNALQSWCKPCVSEHNRQKRAEARKEAEKERSAQKVERERTAREQERLARETEKRARVADIAERAKARAGDKTMTRCKAPHDEHGRSGALCGALVWRKEQVRHLAEVHRIELGERQAGLWFEGVQDVPDTEAAA